MLFLLSYFKQRHDCCAEFWTNLHIDIPRTAAASRFDVAFRRICHAAPATGMLQAAFGKAVITPQRRL
jgi:hypothetical protein